MNYLLITLIFFIIFFIAMGVGFLVAGKKLGGSCGGLGKLIGDDCEFCDKKDECETQKKAKSN